MMKRIVGFCLLSIFISCGKNHNAILSINQMKVVMWDMLNADNWHFQTTLVDSTAQKNKKNVALYQQVFQQEGVTKEQFYKSYKYYQSHPDQMKILLDSTEAYGTRVMGETDVKKPSPLQKIVAPFIKPIIKKP